MIYGCLPVYLRQLQVPAIIKRQKNPNDEEVMEMDFEQVKKIVTDTLGCDEEKVTESASLTDDLEADSLDLVELHMAFEDALGVKIPDETLAKMKTIGDICDYLKTLQKDETVNA